MGNNNIISTFAWSGIGISGLFGIISIILKLCNIIGLSWWWILAPFWVPFGMWVIFALIFLIYR